MNIQASLGCFYIDCEIVLRVQMFRLTVDAMWLLRCDRERACYACFGMSDHCDYGLYDHVPFLIISFIP